MLASLAASICALGSACAARIWVSVSRPCVCFVHSWSVGNFSSPPLDPSRLRGDTADVSAPLAPQALETGDFGIVEPIL